MAHPSALPHCMGGLSQLKNQFLWVEESLVWLASWPWHGLVAICWVWLEYACSCTLAVSAHLPYNAC